jgi:hypothetical protein
MPDARKMLAHKSPARQTPFDPLSIVDHSRVAGCQV